jgi:arylformamidase
VTRAFWDSQLQFSNIIGDFGTIVERTQRESADWSQGRSLETLRYGPNPRQWVETTQGQGGGNLLPVVIHGGYWRALRAEDHRFLMGALLPFGDHVANVEYRLMPQVRLADVVADTVLALKALATRFAEKRLVLVGHSAGAHLAVSALDEETLAPRVAGAVALSGVYDLRPVRLSFLQDELSLSEEEVRRHSLAPRKGRRPVVYVNGSDETHEFLRGSALMASAGATALRVLPKANHMTLLWSARDSMTDLVETLLALEPGHET